MALAEKGDGWMSEAARGTGRTRAEEHARGKKMIQQGIGTEFHTTDLGRASSHGMHGEITIQRI